MKTYKFEVYFGGWRSWHTIEAKNKKEAIDKAQKEHCYSVTVSTVRLIKK